jgi:hypothetical protein
VITAVAAGAGEKCVVKTAMATAAASVHAIFTPQQPLTRPPLTSSLINPSAPPVAMQLAAGNGDNVTFTPQPLTKPPLASSLINSSTPPIALMQLAGRNGDTTGEIDGDHTYVGVGSDHQLEDDGYYSNASIRSTLKTSLTSTAPVLVFAPASPASSTAAFVMRPAMQLQQYDHGIV